jgi:hypothetical protein
LRCDVCSACGGYSWYEGRREGNLSLFFARAGAAPTGTQGVRAAPKNSNRTIPRKDTREELTKEIQPDADTRVLYSITGRKTRLWCN